MSNRYEITTPGKKFDFLLLILIVTFVLLGLFTVLSASIYIAGPYFFKRQLFYALIGFVAMFAGMRMDFYQLRTLLKPAMYIITFFMVATYIPFLGGTTVNGANGWVRIPVISFGFQPSELAKIILVIFAANLLANPEYRLLKFFEKIITVMPILGIIGIIVFQPDIGNTSIISLGVFAVYFAAGLNIARIVAVIIFLGTSVIMLILSNPYQMARITGFMNPWQDPQGKGFQLIQSLIAIGSGGISGKGLGQSMQKLYYLPESHTDFIFSVFSEESGLIGSIFLLFLIFMLAQRGFSIAVRSKDLFVKLLTTGITTLICGQALMNIAVATGVLPTTGITLPFISYGGTSLIVNLFCMGLLLNASMYTEDNWEVLEGKNKGNV
jgi:cell division protein FtsW